MALSNELINQFVKSTKDNTAVNKHSSTIYGTVVYDGKTYVKLDGSELLTPVSTTVNVKDGDRVTVEIKNHSATITGNVTDPSASGKNVDKLSDQITEFESVIAYKVSAEEIDATKATIDNLRAKLADINKLEAVEAEIETLEAKYANLDQVKAEDIEALNADIENLQAKFAEFTDVEVEQLEALNADIDQLKAYNADFTYVSADMLHAIKAEIDNLDVGGLTAEEADIRYAKINDLDVLEGEFEQLKADTITGENLGVINGKIENLETVIFDAESGDIKFANIDFSNIGEAAIEKVFADSGIIKDLVVSEGKITGELQGVKITGDVIDANTIKADSLILQGPNGVYYKLNTIAGEIVSEELTEEELQNGLSGKAIIAKSITANKIAVDDLVAFGATIAGFNITENSLYSLVKDSVDNTTAGVYLDKEGQISFGDEDSYIRFAKDTDDRFTLDISAKNVTFGSARKNMEEAMAEMEASFDENLAATNANISNVSDQMSNLIVDGNGDSLIIPDEDGNLSFNIGNMMDSINGASENIEIISEDLSTAKTNISNLETTVNSFTEYTGYITIDSDNSLITLGKEGSDFKVVISNNDIKFMEGALIPAYINNNAMNIDNAIVDKELKVGNFIWSQRANGNLGLVWKESDE